MLRVYACLTQEHDLRLVVVAGLICLFATYTAFSLMARAGSQLPHRRHGDRTQLAWVTAAGFAAGSGIWSTHFIAMLAFAPHLPMGYALGPTILSIVIAAIVSGLGLMLAHRGALAGRHPIILAGGAVLGGGISIMHYVGMSAVSLAGFLTYDPGMVVVSVLFGVWIGAAATHFAYARKKEGVLGLKAPIRGMTARDVAQQALAISRQGLKSRAKLNASGDDETHFLTELDDIVATGVTPAERLLERWRTDWKGDMTKVFEACAY